MRHKQALATAVLLACLLLLAPSAGARPQAPQQQQLGLPSWGHVCSVMEPVDRYHVLELLEGLTDREEFGTLGMILTVASPTLCKSHHEQQNLLFAQNSLAQQLATNAGLFGGFKSQLPTLVPTIAAQRPQPITDPGALSVARAQIVLPVARLVASNVEANSLTPVDVNWLQFGTGSVGYVDVKAERFASATTQAHTDITKGLYGLSTQSFFGSHYVPLGLGGRTWWSICIRPATTSIFAPYACGLRFRERIDNDAAETLNSLLWTRGKGCVAVYGMQLGVAAQFTHAAARFSLDGEAWSGTFRLDLPSFAGRFVVYARSGLAETWHTLCVENDSPTLARHSLLDVISIS